MKIYNHSHSGEFISEGQADPSPLEPGVFLIPAKATAIAPPPTTENEVAVFNGAEWEVKADFRGTAYWTDWQTSHTISAIGEVVPPGASLTQPEKPAEVLAAEAAALAKPAARAAAKAKFFSLPVPVQVAFLTAWNNINAAMDAGAPQAVILGYFDALAVPPELAAQASAIRADLVVVTSA